MGLLARQHDKGRAALARLAFEPGAAAMKLGKPSHERKTETRAAGLAVVAIVDLVEGHEDLVELVARNAGAVVLDRDLEAAVTRETSHDRDASAFWREFHGIGHEVDQDLLERAL